MQRILTLISLLVVLAGLVAGQTTTSSTTLSAAVSLTDTTLTVASATGITAPGLAPTTMLVVGQEAMHVEAVSGTLITVERGVQGTRRLAHVSGATVWVGPPRAFAWTEPSGACTATAQAYLPLITISTGARWNCIGGVWLEQSTIDPTTIVNVGTAATGVTAAEYGDGRDHITELTFTAKTIGAAVGAADLAFGTQLYTFPAGALVVKAAYMSVALAGSGSTCDADTPDGGVGTVVGSGAVAVLGGTATFENMLTGQAFDDVDGTAEVKTVGDQVLVIEAAAAHTLFFNLADGWAGACTVTGTGTVTVEWSVINN
jgi:hypothetical protein